MTKEEDILHAIQRLEAMSRRKSHEDAPPPPPPGSAPGEFPPPPPPRNQGRGRMLAVLNDNGAMSQAQLAARLNIRPQSLSELLAKAESEGFVERKQSEEDKRQTIVSITEAGRARVAGFRDAHRRRAEEFCSALSEEEKDTLKEILEKLIASRGETESKNTQEV